MAPRAWFHAWYARTPRQRRLLKRCHTRKGRRYRVSLERLALLD